MNTFNPFILNDTKLYFHEDKENDVVLIEVKTYLKEGNDGVHWHFSLDHLAGHKEYMNIKTFDLVCYSGYPSQHDKLGDRPIIRSGHIASDPQYNYSWDKEYHGQCIAYEGFSSEGASGSPIYATSKGIKGTPNSRKGYLAGVNAGHIPGATGHSGISYFYKSNIILEIIESNRL